MEKASQTSQTYIEDIYHLTSWDSKQMSFSIVAAYSDHSPTVKKVQVFELYLYICINFYWICWSASPETQIATKRVFNNVHMNVILESINTHFPGYSTIYSPLPNSLGKR